ncbi:cerebellin-2-like [Ruditapes philippinarum]|uniref:cerebellin-2-like n=1 Tax=Ruditapes philippinarum TaxID=129788 RepID=UPI00295B962B|nr:cerebellin-2-like [Ruditapes philippinarum]
MKIVLFCFLLAISHPFIFCQDADKLQLILSRIDTLENTVALQHERIQVIQKRDESQQKRIEELENIVKAQQTFINGVLAHAKEEDVIARGSVEGVITEAGVKKSQHDTAGIVLDTDINGNKETQPLLVGDPGRNISDVFTSMDSIGEYRHFKRRGKTMARQLQETVAFHATIDVQTHVTQLTIGQTIVFDSVHLNIGGGYHSSGGLFIAPTAGIYMFSLSVMLNTPSHWISLELLKNGAILAETYANGYDQGSVSVATQLKVGDEVFVKVHGSDSGMVYGEKLTSFTGALIMPY